MRRAFALSFSLLAFLSLAVPASAQNPSAQNPAAPDNVTLFENVRVFDGKSPELSPPQNVLVRGNKIERISADPIPTAQLSDTGSHRATTKIIHGGGRTLMPGLIDNHWHAMLVRPTPAEAISADVGYLNLLAAAEARDTLLRGFTTVRDLGGPAFGLKQAIDEGLTPGPRIYPVRRDHHHHQRPRRLPPKVRSAPHARRPALAHGTIGGSMVADSPDEVRLRTREQLLLGACQIKLTAGGGVASPNSPLDASTFTEPELRAAVEAAENWGTYVTVHAYTPVSIRARSPPASNASSTAT